MAQARVRESAKALALMMALWSLMAMVWVMALAQYLRTSANGYLPAGYRRCKWCIAGRNHPHNKGAVYRPYPQKIDSGYPNQSDDQSDCLLGQRK
jgi:hypothetical protein